MLVVAYRELEVSIRGDCGRECCGAERGLDGQMHARRIFVAEETGHCCRQLLGLNVT